MASKKRYDYVQEVEDSYCAGNEIKTVKRILRKLVRDAAKTYNEQSPLYMAIDEDDFDRIAKELVP
jgi:hypothetical protein